MKRHWGVYLVSFMNITNTTQCPSSAFLFLALGAGLPAELASCPEQPHTPGSRRVGCQAGGLVQTCWVCLCDLGLPHSSKSPVPTFCCSQGLDLWLLVLPGDLGDALALESCYRRVSLTRVCFRIQFVAVCFSHPHLPCCSAFDGLEASSNMKSRHRVPGAKTVSRLPPLHL